MHTKVWDGFWENHLGKTLLMRYFLNFVWGNNNRMGCGGPGRMAAWIAESRPYMPHRLRPPAAGRSTLKCEKTAKGHKAAPLCTPLGLFLQSAAIVEHGKLLTYTCMLLYWQFNTKPKCDKQKVLQKAAKTPQTCTARRESRYSYTATIGTAFHAQYRSIQK